MATIVHFETKNNSYSEIMAIFKTEELYIACLPVLMEQAEQANMIVSESIQEEEDV